MRAVLKLECIGDDSRQYLRLGKGIITETLGAGMAEAVVGKIPAACWVAQITGTDPKFKFQREFMQGKKDYSESNSVGSRGVYLHYFLDDGIYEVKEQVSWNRSRRYFLRVTEGQTEEIAEDEVLKCLKSA